MTIHSANLLAEVREHFNAPMLDGFSVARCIGYGEDEMDCYVIVRHPGGKEIWNTMVGGYTWLEALKGQNHVISTEGEHWDDFVRLDNWLALNGCPKADEFRIVMEHEDTE